MYSAIHSLPVDGGMVGGDFQGSLEGTNLPGDACLVLTTDPKPRLRWTAELHERFVDAVTQLGGPDSECNLSFFFLFIGFGFCSSNLSKSFVLLLGLVLVVVVGDFGAVFPFDVQCILCIAYIRCTHLLGIC